MTKTSTCSLLLLCSCVSMVGCRDEAANFRPLSTNGFGIVSQWVGIDSGPGAKLYYKGGRTKPTLIWPFLKGGLTFTNDMVFFVGAYPDAQGALIYNYYYAAQSGGPALDISDQLLKYWADSNHFDFGKIREQYSPFTLEIVGNEMQLGYFDYGSGSNANFNVTWEQVSNSLQKVKREGKQHELQIPHVIYLKIEHDFLTNGN